MIVHEMVCCGDGEIVRWCCCGDGKSGCRRIVPGQYLALDPKARALMIAACEKQKVVYALNRDSAANLTISSSLEAHKSCTVTPLSALIAVGIIQYLLPLSLIILSLTRDPGHPDVIRRFEGRADLPAKRGVLIVSATMHKHKSMFFFLLQTEYGDVFKVTLDHNNDRVTELKIKVWESRCISIPGYWNRS
nr:hypothetical protein [Tanacetum cinerariifolium]